MTGQSNTKFAEDPDTLVLNEETSIWHLIVWNDEINTFDWVIESLIDICNHTREQAEQCALLIHFKGKYSVYHGEYKKLRPMCNALLDRGITATVETTAKV